MTSGRKRKQISSDYRDKRGVNGMTVGDSIGFTNIYVGMKCRPGSVPAPEAVDAMATSWPHASARRIWPNPERMWSVERGMATTVRCV